MFSRENLENEALLQSEKEDMLIEKEKAERASVRALILLEKEMAANEDSFSTLTNERLIHIESLVTCKTKYKYDLASESSLRVEKLATKKVEHQDTFAQKEKYIKIQRDEFTIKNNCFVKSAYEATKKK